MPKVKWLKKPEPPPPPPVLADYLGDMISTHMRARGMTYKELAPLVGRKDADSARHKKFYGVSKYQVHELFSWCKALNVAPDSLATAVSLAYKQELSR